MYSGRMFAPRLAVLGFALAISCEPQPTQPAVVAPAAPAVASDGCRDDIPDCAAACALRATHHDEFVDFYDRRCAAVILGKNPDKIEPLEPTPYPSATAQTAAPASSEFPPGSRGSFSLQPPPAQPFDPSAVTRTGGAEPAECRAARMLRAQHRDHEADMLSALCVAKGGDAGI